jgi:3,4-dihydroxy-2-butanone 4-phosphate synthase
VARVDDDGLRRLAIPRRSSGRTSAPRRRHAVNLEVDFVAKYVEKLVGGASVSRAPPTPVRDRRGGARGRSRPAGWSSSSTTRTGENEATLVIAAEHVTADVINFMATHARGWICLALTPERCDELGLELMTAKNETPHQTPFTVTIEAREGVTTGISAADRAHTIRVAVDPAKGAEDIVKGGHVNPLKAKPGGVLERTGHTEASVDLARLAGLAPAGVICEIMNEDGSMARVGDLQAYCFKHGLRLITDRRPHRLPPAPRQARRARR